MSQNEATRTYRVKRHDQMAAALMLGDVSEIRQISMAAIASFCATCDQFKADTGTCTNVSDNNQARYVARGSCGWAKVAGRVGTMTRDGFSPSGGSESSSS